VLDVRTRPIARLLAAGALLVLATHALPLWSAEPASARAIVIDAARIDAARRAFRAEHGRTPDAGEVDALIAAEIDDEILFREALALGLASDDSVVQHRLSGSLAFVEHGPPDAALASVTEAGALADDLVQRDLVVRRRLVDRMRARLEALGATTEPSDAELQAMLDATGDRFALPARVRVAYAAAGAPELLRELPPSSSRDLERAFGSAFAGAAFATEPGRWSAPVVTPSGSYRVLVRERSAAHVPPLATVRNQVRATLLRARADAAARRALDQLRTGYTVTVAAPDAPTRAEKRA
jgi:hypothetical protein